MAMELTLIQEVEVMYIIPTIRRYLAIYLKELGKPQKAIAKLLSSRESTVSQYINEKRGCKIKFREETTDAIKKAVKRILNKYDTIREIQILLRNIRNSDEICVIHKQVANMPDNCDPIDLGCNHTKSKEELYGIK